MKVFLDSADIEEITEFASWRVLEGITTTPTFFRRLGVTDAASEIRRIAETVPLDEIHVEALGRDADEIVATARANAELAPNIVSKVPVSPHGLAAASVLEAGGIPVNLHLVFTDNPALPHGIVYEGVETTEGRPQHFRGQTGSQSSIVPVMDALLAVGHHQDPLRRYLDELHPYRPPGHRRFIERVRSDSSVRDAVKAIDDPRLTAAYNDCLERLTRFRTRHLEYAAHYIQKQSRGGKGNTSDVGTGGTPFMKYLKKHRDEAALHRL